MRRRQTGPEQWLIVNGPVDRRDWDVFRRLPYGSGIVLIHRPSAQLERHLRWMATQRGFTLAREARGKTIRVHNAKELTRALVRRPLLVLLSPIFETSSHPDWRPLPRMRAASLARLCNRTAIALGGMNAERYKRLESLGFTGWAGISAFKT